MSVVALKYDAQATNGVGPVAEKTPGEALTEILRQDKCQRYTYDDQGNGFLFADYFKKSCRYCPDIKGWYYYDGKAWRVDGGGLYAREAAKKLASILRSIKISDSDADIKAFSHNAKTLMSFSKREAMLKDAQSVYPLYLKELDADKNLFNCLNGTLRLDKLELKPHSPDDKISLVSGVIYDPEATLKHFGNFMRDITLGDVELARYMQAATGYALKGDPTEECLFILYGPSTRNGKGTFMSTITAAFGEYARTASPETVATKRFANSSGPSEDVARLCGPRLVSISEPAKSMRFNAALVKTLTGQDMITARMLYQESIQFKPRFVMFINTNYLPAIDDDSLFKSKRIRLIPFNRHFEEHEQDKDLKNKLLQPEELSAVFNWIIRGWKRYQEDKLKPPPSVKKAIEAYRHDSDKIVQFMEEVTRPVEGNACISTISLYKRYVVWCEDNGVYPESHTKFTHDLKGKGYVIDRCRYNGSEKINHVKGIAYADDPAPVSSDEAHDEYELPY